MTEFKLKVGWVSDSVTQQVNRRNSKYNDLPKEWSYVELKEVVHILD